MAEVDENGNYNDLWERVLWSDCYLKNSREFVKLKWHNTTNLQITFSAKSKRDTVFWRIPQNIKKRESNQK